MSGHTVLVVDDDLHIRRLLRNTLDRAGYAVVEAVNAHEALKVASETQPEVVLLDLGLPDRDGLELVPLLKKAGKPAILVVSAREATEEKVAALDLGADDYVTKPFDTEELLARLRVALRRRAQAGGAEAVVTAGDLVVDLVQRRVTKGGDEVHLTRKEYDVLITLAAAPGRVVTHQRILAAAWPRDHERHIEYLRIVVRNLRQKVETNPAEPTIIVNELGVGYRLIAAP